MGVAITKSLLVKKFKFSKTNLWVEVNSYNPIGFTELSYTVYFYFEEASTVAPKGNPLSSLTLKATLSSLSSYTIDEIYAALEADLTAKMAVTSPPESVISEI